MASPSTSTSQFDPTVIDLGEVAVGQTSTAIFTRNPALPADVIRKDVMRVDLGCYCLATRIGEDDIRVDYRAQPIPSQVQKDKDFAGFATVLKWVTIVFTDQTFELVQLKARVVKL